MQRFRLPGLWHGIGWALVAAVILLSLLPDPPVADVGGSDKLGHALSYAVLMSWFTQLYPRVAHRRLALAFVALGAALEGLQALVPPRSADALDLAANTSGVGLGWVLAAIPGIDWLGHLDRYAAHWLLDRLR